MSVMNQLKQFSENPEAGGTKQAEFNREFLNESQDTKGAEGLDAMLTDVPIAGQSLTQDPGQRLPHESPPEFTNLEDFMEELFTDLTGEDRLPLVLEVMRKGFPLENIAQKILRKKVQKGAINPDLMLLGIEPTIYMLIALATYADIDAVLYPEGDDELDDDMDSSMISKFKQGAQDLTEGTEEGEPLDVADIQAPTVVPRNLMDRVSTAVDSVESQVNPGNPVNAKETI